MGVVSRLTATAPPGGRRRTSNPGWPRGPPPVGASRRDLPTGCARRSPERSPGDGGSIPPTSTIDAAFVLLDGHFLPTGGELHLNKRLDALVPHEFDAVGVSSSRTAPSGLARTSRVTPEPSVW